MKLSQKDLKSLCETATIAATEAGVYIQSQLDQSYQTQSKTGGDSLASQVVTEVDIKAQEIILKHLKPSIAQHDLGLLTEEAVDDQSRLEKDHFWCIDPLDGTLPFTERRSGYAVSIALVSKSGDPVIGVIYVPNEKANYAAVKGNGVQLNGKAFNRNAVTRDNKLHWYMDRSFQSESYFETVKTKMNAFVTERQMDLEIHATYGAVTNAIGVLNSSTGCYFKFPKPRKGGGSIWDYAATRLLFEELELPVFNAAGEKLDLNNPKTTFMNDQGVVYATDSEALTLLLDLR